VALRHNGFAVWLAADGELALELYRQHHREITVVLLDVRMPGWDGPQTLAALRDIDPQVRCCFMTGHVGSYDDADLQKLGAVHTFKKPFRLAEVIDRIRKLAGPGQHEGG
jgi:DNA-binding response OmpR family regulator